MRDHGSGADDAVGADFRHHHGGLADPCAGADADEALRPSLFADRPRRIVESMRRRTAWNVNARRNQCVALDVDQAEPATRSDVDVFIDPGAGARYSRPGLDDRGFVTTVQRAAQKCPADVLARKPRDERQPLNRSLEGAIAAQ